MVKHFPFSTIFSPYGCRAIQKSNCYHKEGHEAACSFGDTSYMLLFGVVQIVLSQTPDFHNIEWLSIFAAIMSFAYSFIGLGLGFAKVVGMLAQAIGLYIEKENGKGTRNPMWFLCKTHNPPKVLSVTLKSLWYCFICEPIKYL